MNVTGDKMMSFPPELTPARAGILKTLAYFDIFHYPLSKEEISRFLEQQQPAALLETTVEELVNEQRIFLYKDFYSLHDNPLFVYRRIKGNRHAMELLPKALRIGRFLHRFPFVRAVAISGSLSKNFADEKADIDFFIITKANRLWIARTIMHLFKKLTFLIGRQHYYCMNYYIDEKALLLEDKNIFTAMELKTLLPVSGEESVNRFFETNKWTHDFLPVCPFRQPSRPDDSRLMIKRLAEWCWNNRAGEKLDDYLMELTTARWKRKQEKGKRNEKGYTMGLMTGKHFARSNPGSFQEKVLSMYKKKLEELYI